jgi:hypothetical protein
MRVPGFFCFFLGVVVDPAVLLCYKNIFSVWVYPCSFLFRRGCLMGGKPKNFDRKGALKKLILSLLTPREVWRLRSRYTQGDDTIMELSRKSGCPPVLLYSILTPLYSKTAIKLKMLRIEQRVYFLVREGLRLRDIAKRLDMTEQAIREYSEDQYEDKVALLRSWYNDRSPKPSDPNELVYAEDTLPPTSRLGWSDGVLTDISDDRKGRCPTCGYLVSLPCHACRVREDMKKRSIPHAEECDDSRDDEAVREELFFF